MSRMMKSGQRSTRWLAMRSAALAAMEPLESRRLLAGDTSVVQAIPYILNFDKTRRGIVDGNGQGTGFSLVQPNEVGDEYQASLIDIKPDRCPHS